MITEVYVPATPRRLHGRAPRGVPRERANVIYGTIRLIERDDESFLAWARDRWACIIFNLCVPHARGDRAGGRRLPRPDRPRDPLRRQLLPHLPPLGDAAIRSETCYPQFLEFLRRSGLTILTDGSRATGTATTPRCSPTPWNDCRYQPSRCRRAAAKFLVVGAGGYVANVGVFALLEKDAAVVRVQLDRLLPHRKRALMYLGNRYFTFRLGNDGFWSAYLRYLIVGAVVAALNAVVLTALVQGTGIDPRIGVAISLLIVTPVAFVLFKRWTFPSGAPSAPVQVTPDRLRQAQRIPPCLVEHTSAWSRRSR